MEIRKLINYLILLCFLFDMDILDFYNFGLWLWMFGLEVFKILLILKDMNVSKYGNMNYFIRMCFRMLIINYVCSVEMLLGL